MARKKARSVRPRLTAITITQAGRDYLADLSHAFLRGGLGEVEIKPQMGELLDAMHRVATGGKATVTASGGSPGELNRLLAQHIEQVNRINDRLGFIVLDS
jgi:hypothetical protein